MARHDRSAPARLTFTFATRVRRGPAGARSGALPGGPVAVPRPRRSDRAGSFHAELDQANYSCSCGFVFRAAVLTSVSCPHCGRGQAW